MASKGLAAAVVALAVCAAPSPAAPSLAALLAEKAPTVVPVRMVLKTEMKFGGNAQSQESRLELEGTVVDAGGLVMIANTPLSPSRIFSLMGRSMEGAEINVTPTDIKVILGADEKEYDAFLAATDSKVDLAFVQVRSADRPALVAVGFDAVATPAVGDRLAVVSRLAKGFDTAPYVETTEVVGQITKPRPAWALGGSTSVGMPAYALDGRLAGVVVTLESGVASDAGDPSFGFAAAMRMLAGGGGLIRPFLLPAATLRSLVDRAKEQAAAKLAESASATDGGSPRTGRDGGAEKDPPGA